MKAIYERLSLIFLEKVCNITEIAPSIPTEPVVEPDIPEPIFSIDAGSLIVFAYVAIIFIVYWEPFGPCRLVSRRLFLTCNLALAISTFVCSTVLFLKIMAFPHELLMASALGISLLIAALCLPGYILSKLMLPPVIYSGINGFLIFPLAIVFVVSASLKIPREAHVACSNANLDEFLMLVVASGGTLTTAVNHSLIFYFGMGTKKFYVMRRLERIGTYSKRQGVWREREMSRSPINRNLIKR